MATGLAVPLFLQGLNLLSGGALVPWSFVLDDALFMSLLGGAAAAGSLKMAQYSERLLPGQSVEDDDLPALGE